MTTVLIVKNIATEGPGTIADYLKEKAIPYQVLNMYEPGEMPDIRPFTHLVIMGGPMAVYETDQFPYLHIEAALIRSFIKQRKPVLGICLGSQLIASALDAKVYAGGTQEIGWSTVEITAEGMTDKVFSSLGLETAEVFQWHGDTFDIPKKSVLLASSSLYTNQAFRYGSNVYGLQFHIEVSPEIIEEWFTSNPGVNLAAMLDHANKIYPDYRERAQLFYERFFA